MVFARRPVIPCIRQVWQLCFSRSHERLWIFRRAVSPSRTLFCIIFILWLPIPFRSWVNHCTTMRQTICCVSPVCINWKGCPFFSFTVVISQTFLFLQFQLFRNPFIKCFLLRLEILHTALYSWVALDSLGPLLTDSCPRPFPGSAFRLKSRCTYSYYPLPWYNVDKFTYQNCHASQY